MAGRWCDTNSILGRFFLHGMDHHVNSILEIRRFVYRSLICRNIDGQQNDRTATSSRNSSSISSSPAPATIPVDGPSTPSSSTYHDYHQHHQQQQGRRVPHDGKTLNDFVSSHKQRHETPASTSSSPVFNGHLFHIKTYGCQMNVNDTDIVRAVLLDHGYQEAPSEEEATIWLTNTCAIRDKAEQKVWQRLQTQKNTILKQHTGKRSINNFNTSNAAASNNNHKHKNPPKEQQPIVVGVSGHA